MGQIIKIQCIDSSERTQKLSSRLIMLDTIEALVLDSAVAGSGPEAPTQNSPRYSGENSRQNDI